MSTISACSPEELRTLGEISTHVLEAQGFKPVIPNARVTPPAPSA